LAKKSTLKAPYKISEYIAGKRYYDIELPSAPQKVNILNIAKAGVKKIKGK
jgi:hypothetical protein